MSIQSSLLPTTMSILGDPQDNEDLMQGLMQRPSQPKVEPVQVEEEQTLPPQEIPPVEEEVVPKKPLTIETSIEEEEVVEEQEGVAEDGLITLGNVLKEEALEEPSPEEEAKALFWEELRNEERYLEGRRHYLASLNLKEVETTLEEEKVENESDDLRVMMAMQEGLKDTANNLTNFVDFVVHLGDDEWEDPYDIRTDLTEGEEYIKLASELGAFAVGTVIVAKGLALATPAAIGGGLIVGVSNLLRFAGITGKANRYLTATASWLPAEVLSAQAFFGEEDGRLVDLIREWGSDNEQPELAEELIKDPLNNSVHNRMVNVMKDTADFSIGTAAMGPLFPIFRGLGKVFVKNQNKALRKTGTGNPYKEMVGLGNTQRSKVSSLSEYLDNFGYTPKEIETKVVAPFKNGATIDRIAKANDVNLDDVIKRATTDKKVQKKLLAKSLMEDKYGLSPTDALAATRALDSNPSKIIPEGTLIDDFNNALLKNQDEFLKNTARTDLEQATKNGALKRLNNKDESVISNWWDRKFKPLLFDMGKPFKNLDTIAYGKVADGGVVKAVGQDFTGYSNLSGQLADNYATTVHTRVSGMLGDYSPITSTRYNQADGIGKTFLDVDGFSGIMKKGNLTEKDVMDLLHYKTALSIKSASKRSEQFWLDTPTYKEWLAKGEGKSDAWHQASDDLSDLLQVALRQELHHGLIDEKSFAKMVLSDVDPESGKSLFFPRETETIKKGTALDKTSFAGLDKLGGSSVKGLKGNSGAPLLDPLERLFNHFHRSVSRVENNKIKQSLYSTIEDMRGAGGWKTEAANNIAVKVKSKEWADMVSLKKELKDQILTSIKTGDTSGLDLRVLDNNTAYKSIDDVTTEDLIKILGNNRSIAADGQLFDVVYYKGKAEVYQVLDPALRDGINSLGPQVVKELGDFGNKFFGFTKGFTKFKGALITKTPTFLAPAQLREMVSSTFFSQTSNVPSLTYFRGTLGGHKIMAEAQMGGFGLDNTRLNAASEAFGMAVKASTGTKEKAYAKMLEGQVNSLRKGYYKYSDMVNRIEVSPKLGELSQAIKMGLNPQDAANAANNIMNFSRRSSSAKVQLIADHMLFLKPSVIGMSKLAESVVDNPAKMSLFVGGYMASDMAIDHLLAEYYPETKASIPEWATLVNTLTPNLKDWGEVDQLVEAIVKQDPSLAPELDPEHPLLVNFGAHENATIAKLGKDVIYNTYEWLSGDKTSNDSIMKAAGRFRSGTFGIFGNVPDILAPLWHLGVTGKDQFGRDIVSQRMSTVGDPSTQISSSNRPSSVYFSKVLNQLGYKAYPSQVDWFGNWLLPGVGEVALNLADKVVSGENMLTTSGGRSKTSNLLGYFPEALEGRFFMGPSELSAARSALHQLNNSIYQLDLNLDNQTATSFFHENISDMKVTLANGNEVLIDEVFQDVAAAKASMDFFREQRTLIQLGHPSYAHLKSEEEREMYLDKLHAEEEGTAYEVYRRLKSYDIESASELLGDHLVGRFNPK